MWRFVAFVSIWVFCTNAQNERIQRPFDNRHGWDIRLAVPGEPGHDYPILNSIPRTSFTCSGKEPGYYADIETNCQVFRVCTLGATYGYQSFLCPNGTLFNQAVFVCDWWMQVNCQKTTDIIKKNNDQFGKLKLGPEFMTDIKKMITHPMRNPYNSAYSKNNFISMQEYKPPTGQLYSGNNYKNFQQSLSSFIPKVHQNQQNYFKDIYSNTDISFAASTPSTHYIHNYNSLNERKQHLPFQDLNKARNTNQALLSNSHGGQFPQNNNKFLSINTSPNQSQVKSNFYNNRNLQTGRQTTYSIDYSKQQLNPHIKQEQQLYLPGPTRAKYSRDIIGSVEKETKQNLDLVFSLLADSINTAKEYNNVAQQHFAKPTNTQSQFYNVQTNNLGGISKDTQLLPAQFPRYQPANLNNAFKIIQPTPNVPTRNENYFKTATQNQYSQLTPQSARTQNNNRNQFYSSEYLRSPSNIQANPEQIYSGQLYQLPVPDVTRQIYNSPHPSVSNLILSNSFLPPYSKQTGGAEAEVEIIPSQIIPTSPLSPVLNSQETTSDQGSSANVFIDDFQIPKDAISAHIQDNIIGTIPHPEDNEKFIKYKKDQSYYFYSHLNSKSNNYEPNSNQTNSIYLLSNLTKPTFQLIPSVGYKLDDETEKQNFLNVFQINDHGNPRKNQVDENINFNRRQDINSDIDFTVIHPTSTYQKPKLNGINIIYNGPNSYSAPQASVGRLDANQNAIKDSSYNARLEKIDVYDKEYGYPKITPVTKFLS